MKNFLTESKLGRKLGPKGIYITMGACLIALAGAGTAAYNKAVSDISESIVIDDGYPVKAADNKTEGVPMDNSSESSEESSSSPAETSSSSESETDSKAPVITIRTQPNVMPVNGDIINPFSAGELVKDPTLGVWRTHDGVDIKADVGTPVKAMNKGTVLEVKEDALWGNCVIIDHYNGVVGHYYSLTKAITVKTGDEVDAGTVIGAVGDTAECEVGELSHLHFGLKRNNEWIDPLEFIGMNSAK
ncbi:MAG: M23 family metallopeptidase [Ruminococcus sp.]|nr:M23 family metallopeptidase [Ruminococcus sp.]